MEETRLFKLGSNQPELPLEFILAQLLQEAMETIKLRASQSSITQHGCWHLAMLADAKSPLAELWSTGD